MRFTAYKLFSIEPIGDVRFIFSSKSRAKGTKVLISEIDIYHDTKMTIDIETFKGLIKLMKSKKSDLLTDGTNFYTLLGQYICKISHPVFYKELELYRESIYNK
jgi:hypothetical protein